MPLYYKNTSLTPLSDSVVYITTLSYVCLLATEHCLFSLVMGFPACICWCSCG